MHRRYPLLFVLFLAGCADAARYPSLLPRATEQQGFAEPDAPPPVPVGADPALDARIATITNGTRTKDVDAALANAERRVAAARGAAAGSDVWLDAQVALGELDARRSDDVSVLTDLEQLAGERATTLAPPYPPLDRAIEETRAALAARAARIAALQASLAPVN